MKLVRLAAVMACAVPAAASAQQIVLSSNNVIGASSVFAAGAGNSGSPFAPNDARVIGTYSAGNLFNSQLASPGLEQFASGEYFLTGDGDSYPTVANPYVTVDLGTAFNLATFTLFNTSNGFVNDRGTANFTIRGANSVVVDGNNGFTLAGPTVTLVNGTLAQQTSSFAPAAQSFGSLSNTAVRYIQFLPTSATARNLYRPTSYGLNELKVFAGQVNGAVPEPATWAMMIGGFGVMGYTMRRRRPIAVAGLA